MSRDLMSGPACFTFRKTTLPRKWRSNDCRSCHLELTIGTSTPWDNARSPKIPGTSFLNWYLRVTYRPALHVLWITVWLTSTARTHHWDQDTIRSHLIAYNMLIPGTTFLNWYLRVTYRVAFHLLWIIVWPSTTADLQGIVIAPYFGKASTMKIEWGKLDR